MWLHFKCIHCLSIPIGYSKKYYPIIMIVHSCNNLIFIFDKVVYQQIFLWLVRQFEVYLILKPNMIHIEGHQSQLVIYIMNIVFRAQFVSRIQWCSETFWFIFFLLPLQHDLFSPYWFIYLIGCQKGPWSILDID